MFLRVFGANQAMPAGQSTGRHLAIRPALVARRIARSHRIENREAALAKASEVIASITSSVTAR
jgi:hypothetical protein